MNRAQLETAIRLATEIIHQDSVYIIGSQSILGSYSEDELPAVVTLSAEVDIAPVKDDASETAADLLDGQLGEWSSFYEAKGFYIQGVGKHTANLPHGWRDRLVPVHPAGAPRSTGLCPESHDLCAAKILANREKDLEFVSALLQSGLVTAGTLRERVDQLDPAGASGDRIDVARRWAIWAEKKYDTRGN